MRKIIKNVATPKDLIGEDRNYMGYVDFALNGITEKIFTIKSVQVDEIPIAGSAMTQIKSVLVFEDANKCLILNSGNRNAILRLHGELKNWPGKQIKITTDANIKMKGKQTGGLVVKGVE